MSQNKKLLQTVMSGTSDNSILFQDLCKILDRFGFGLRIKGSHHIYYRDDIEEIINIQPKGKYAKAYQVKEVRNIILKYKLGGIE